MAPKPGPEGLAIPRVLAVPHPRAVKGRRHGRPLDCPLAGGGADRSGVLERFEPSEAHAGETTSCHEEIAAAIIDRDGAGASRLMAEHMTANMSSAYTQHRARLEDVLDWR